jgi:hypothetical protein
MHTTARIVRTTKIEIQIGDRTHHHDQSICPVNFRQINKMVSKPPNPMPLEAFDFEDFIYFLKLLSLLFLYRASLRR